MNYNDENIEIGKLLHEETFKNRRKNILYGDVNFDLIITGKKEAIIEIKKSSRLVDPAKYQLYYYLWYAKKSGVNLVGILVYPKERKREEIVLTEDIEREIEDIIIKIKEVISTEKPPPIIKKSYCKKCSYYELCNV
jgi:CRISPR-associated exonuclease Cas4